LPAPDEINGIGWHRQRIRVAGARKGKEPFKKNTLCFNNFIFKNLKGLSSKFLEKISDFLL